MRPRRFLSRTRTYSLEEGVLSLVVEFVFGVSSSVDQKGVVTTRVNWCLVYRRDYEVPKDYGIESHPSMIGVEVYLQSH